MMGTKESAHKVKLSDFYMSKTEITIGDWRIYCEENNIDMEAYLIDIRNEAGFHIKTVIDDNLPMFEVSWVDGIKYCNWLSTKKGLDPVYEVIVADVQNKEIDVKWNKRSNGYRLPTEAEWEYAARGGSHSKGYLFSGSNNINDVAWYHDNANLDPHSVGQKKANELGLYDMTGNVAEWCWDYFDLDYYKNTSYEDPAVSDTTKIDEDPAIRKVYRGGSYVFFKRWATNYFRVGTDFYDVLDVGFRLVRNKDN